MPKNIFQRNGIQWARFKVKNVQYCFSLRTRSEAEAERRLKSERQRIIDQAYYGAAEPVSWEAAVVEWNSALPRLDLRPATVSRYLVSLGQAREWFDGVHVQKIDGAFIKRFIRDRSKRGVTNATIRRDLSAISSVLAVAVDEGWIEENPAKMIDRTRVKEKRDPITLPDPDDIEAVLALRSRFTDLAAFARETGMRESEIVNLKHNQVRGNVATLTATKTGRARAVTLTAKALEIIGRQPRHYKGQFVFWRGDGVAFKNVSAQFYATVRRVQQKVRQAGGDFRPFRFHDLRHLFAVEYLRELRGSIYALQQELGHTSVKTTEYYLRYLTPAEKLAAQHGVSQNGHRNQRLAQGEGGENG
ncbi:MAG: site-specific integrase [Sphingopyxis sp.]|nr:site-specific integrase [Sphingopyxis sp.]